MNSCVFAIPSASSRSAVAPATEFDVRAGGGNKTNEYFSLMVHPGSPPEKWAQCPRDAIAGWKEEPIGRIRKFTLAKQFVRRPPGCRGSRRRFGRAAGRPHCQPAS